MPVTPDEPKPSPDDLLPGSNFGGYEVVRKLGRGAFGGVYEALRMPLRKRCALKVLHREYVNYPDVINRFLREAEIVARLEPLFVSLSPGDDGTRPTPGRESPDSSARSGYLHCGPNGAGHFVKMVHNGIEYGDMQLIGEAYQILRDLCGFDGYLF